MLAAIQKEITRQFGDRPLDNPDYGKIINEKHFERILGLIAKEKIICGGESDSSTLRIAPTVLTDVSWDDPVMGEEIFGPLLPVLTYSSLDEAIRTVESHPHPLALYFFSEDKKAQKKVFAKNQAMSTHTGCPGSRSMQIQRFETPETIKSTPSVEQLSKLQNWPVQIKLAPANAPYFNDAKLLIAADCTAYAYASFHQDFIRNKVTLIGCPKLDQVDYSDKLTEIIQNNNIQSVTIVRMEVPCCGGLEMAVKNALQNSGKFIPWQVVTISIDGKIID